MDVNINQLIQTLAIYALPVLFGANRTPWWRGPGEDAPVGEGIVRIFLVEEVRKVPGAPPLPSGEPPADFWARERPLRGAFRVGSTPVSPPEATPDAPLVLAVRALVQD